MQDGQSMPSSTEHARGSESSSLEGMSPNSNFIATRGLRHIVMREIKSQNSKCHFAKNALWHFRTMKPVVKPQPSWALSPSTINPESEFYEKHYHPAPLSSKQHIKPSLYPASPTPPSTQLSSSPTPQACFHSYPYHQQSQTLDPHLSWVCHSAYPLY